MGKEKKNKIDDSREIALESLLAIAKYFFKTEHLHYGYWPSDLEVDFRNLPEAQQNYCDFLIAQIPANVKTILDVGCGIGTLALELRKRGYQVDCVSPSEVLTAQSRSRLGEESHIFECFFEDLQTEKRYDLMLFSESFQYIDLDVAFDNSIKFLNDKGFILICDFFRKSGVEGKGNLRGGHKLEEFHDLISKKSLTQIKDIDITDNTAPNLDLAGDFLVNAGLPIWNVIFKLLERKFPFISKLVVRKYHKKIEKIHNRYFSGERSATNFSTYKSYRLFLYQRQ